MTCLEFQLNCTQKEIWETPQEERLQLLEHYRACDACAAWIDHSEATDDPHEVEVVEDLAQRDRMALGE